jgi:hypothetical protein
MSFCDNKMKKTHHQKPQNMALTELRLLLYDKKKTVQIVQRM